MSGEERLARLCLPYLADEPEELLREPERLEAEGTSVLDRADACLERRRTERLLAARALQQAGDGQPVN